MGVLSQWVRALAALTLALLVPQEARADTWALPTVTTYEAPAKAFRLTVTPRAIADRFSYFSEAVEKKDKPGQVEGGPEEPRALLERRDAAGRWIRVWEAPLVNGVSPVLALVSDKGDYVATFDNWHSMGWGKDAVALYDANGKLIRAMALVDFLPEDWFLTLPRSVTSIWWRGEPRFEDGKLIVPVVLPGSAHHGKSAEYVELALDPATGKGEPLDAVKWQRGLAVAARGAVAVRAAHAEYLAMLRAPLSMPDGVKDQRTLHWFLTEAFQRLDPKWETDYPDTHVLDRRGSGDYSRSREWLRTALQRGPVVGAALGFASYDVADLANALVTEAARVEAGPLKGIRVYATIAARDRKRVADALERLGAVFIQLDPVAPIVQRPERVPGPATE